MAVAARCRPRAKKLEAHIQKHFRTLPWCPRYLERSGETNYMVPLRNLVSAGVVEASSLSGNSTLWLRARSLCCACNAVWNVRSHSGRAEVRVALKATEDEVHVDVTDNGSGIDSSRLPHIFEPKFTTKTHGLGLGLAMVSAIVRGAGGSVSVLSTSHQGTTFRVSLPQSAKG